MNNTFQGYFSQIPSRALQDKELSSNAKLLFGIIASLTQIKGYCYASNSYLAEALGKTERTTYRLLNELADRGYIVRQIIRDTVTGQVAERRIFSNWNAPFMPEEDQKEEYISNVAECGAGLLAAPICDHLSDDNFDVQNDIESYVLPPDKNVSRLPDKNVKNLRQKCQVDNINNKIIPPIVPQKESAKRGAEAQARSELKEWACNCVDAGLTEGGKQDLIEALMAFCDMRAEKRKPIRSGRAVTLLENRLVRYSDNNPALMIALLDEAVIHQWDSVYPLRDGGFPQQGSAEPKEETKWV